MSGEVADLAINMVPESDIKPESKAFIALEQVTKMYANGSLGLSEVSLNLNRGQFLFVTGASGVGKSTFNVSEEVRAIAATLTDVKRKAFPGGLIVAPVAP
ncbi:hypothetical protein PROH_09905 [Prochlorothrix hollandica PCC 9006 = CALU 1027]|uniref:ABC transporter domain-containing protein n=1 Tax=Prochlorothrix hollandica PCC 9006 = CALU 1027 TaxID=317619 RepID=A0A0M2Q091_PROHO|nr:hypothetical protein [Prochlorothrix hollandica]KKJ00062.1 hypothetical protein PROH_09905 [Prochlorothrix hollandica PCC 9006 = CALU 1027]